MPAGMSSLYSSPQTVLDPNYSGYGYSDPNRGHVVGKASLNTLGASTQNNVPAPQPQQQPVQQPVQQPQPQQQQPDPYEPVYAELDKLAGMVPGQKNQMTSMVQNMVGSGKENLGIQRDQSLAQLDTARQDVKTKQKETFRDIESDMRNMLQAGQVYLGTRGAADSSATGRLSGALAKSSSRSKAVVRAQTNKMWSDINLRENQITDTYNQKLNELDQWKDNKLLEIENWAANILSSTQGQRAEVKKHAIDTALHYMNQLDAQMTNYYQALQGWVMDRTNDTAGARQILSQMSQYQLSPINRAPLPEMQMGSGQPRAFYPGGATNLEDRYEGILG